jgi:hypothetical protein
LPRQRQDFVNQASLIGSMASYGWFRFCRHLAEAGVGAGATAALMCHARSFFTAEDETRFMQGCSNKYTSNLSALLKPGAAIASRIPRHFRLV